MDLAALKRGKELDDRIDKIDKALKAIESINDDNSYKSKKIFFTVSTLEGDSRTYLTPLIPENMQSMLTDLITDSLLTEKLLLEKELESL